MDSGTIVEFEGALSFNLDSFRGVGAGGRRVQSKAEPPEPI